ncbi:saccharopine dehydrogenase NADP-binding domain-containing protein [Streptomyces sp. XM4193]|uniref:saccharopine dehydrogenase family protein n=1 Tax=Streptomyces sp. XM4193 TaxID=2929782 RepID=UPI001FFA4E93|nr:saccharopine dehydrogenase NADP-binding domain-containing protein [Streptomyces sp. XM4193]MCK1797289.1 saccharopine dehydrogenase NADP-binding domain-containing protein [Streptomyces sp. XM4193]
MPRKYDVVLFGATGFVGRLTAEYLAENAPEHCRWALAGRDTAKLTALRAELAARFPELAELPLLRADSGDPDSLRELAGSTRVLATTVGPYLQYGEPLAAACADAGTDYLDLTGEPQFVDTVYVNHHARARETGARLVHACGFDSVPHDLGVLFTVLRMPQDVPLRVEGYVRAKAGMSGGTFASALESFARWQTMSATARARRELEPRPRDRRISTPVGRIRRAKGMPAWAVPLPTIDPQIVGRSAAQLERYGPDFEYRHAAAVRRLPVVAGGVLGVAGIALAAQIPPARRKLGAKLAPGDGPSESRRARSWFSVRFTATGGGQTVRTEVSGGDPGYGETAKMLAESALCLAFDELPHTSGQVTTAVAMGEPLIERLRAAGIVFRVA